MLRQVFGGPLTARRQRAVAGTRARNGCTRHPVVRVSTGSSSAINARTSGYLRKWYVDIGSRVREGQLLAEIESPEVDQQLAQARAEAAQAKAKVTQAGAAMGTAQAGLEQARADAVRPQALPRDHCGCERLQRVRPPRASFLPPGHRAGLLT